MTENKSWAVFLPCNTEMLQYKHSNRGLIVLKLVLTQKKTNIFPPGTLHPLAGVSGSL